MIKLPKEAVLELEVRRRIYDIIVESPGLHFRELKRRANVAYGSLQYHLEFLIRHKLIQEEKGSEYSRFFPSDFKSVRERELLSLLRQESIRRILLHLLAKPNCRNKDLVDEVGLSPSTVSWHIGRLLRSGAVLQQNRVNDVVFRVSEPEVVTRLLVTYKGSFLDRIVDRFVEVWERENLTAKAP
jgi:predicted transcriptional regulator